MMTRSGNLRKENLQIALAATIAIAGLLGVSVMMFLDTHASRWDRLATLEEMDVLRLEMAHTEARVRNLSKRAEQLETTHRQMTASFLDHMGVGPLSAAETPDAVTEILAFEGPIPPNPGSPEIETLTEHMDSLGDYINDVYRSMLERQEYAKAIPTLSPTTGWVSSHFGSRDSPFTGNQTTHNGIDIAAPKGTPIFAAADGVVGFAGKFGGYGKYVLINHGFGIVTRYGHVSRYFVYPGQFVHRGQKIASVGSTGRSTGSHLHYEVRVANRAVDPRPFMLDAGEKILGDLWELNEGIPRAPLPDFAPMGGDPEEAESEPTPVIGTTKARAVPESDVDIEQTLQAEFSAPSLLPPVKDTSIDRALEALMLLVPWLMVGISLALLTWVAWRVSRRLRVPV